jgi:DNA topoisomerase IB
MHTSLSAVQKDSVVAFLKLLATLYVTYDQKLTKEQLRRMNMWASEASEFITKFKLTRLATKALRLVVSGEDPNKDDDTDAAITELLIAMKEKMPLFQKETDINRIQLGLINDFRLAHMGSETAARRLLKGVTSIGDPMVTQFYQHDFDALDHGSVYTKLAALVKRYGKVSGYIMPTEILEDWQAQAKAKGVKHPGHAEYLMLRREVNDVYKKALANIVRSSNEKYLPLRDVMQRLKGMGVINNLPANFVGNIDDLGNFYTTTGKKLLQNPSGEVLMNPKYDSATDNAYVCQFTPPFAQKPTRAYTVEYRQGAKSEKFEVVNSILPKLNALTKKWLPDLRLINKDKEGVLAALCEFIYDTSARVGNKNAATGGVKTYGATQLEVKHFKFAQNSCVIKYQGKSGGAQNHKVSFTSVRGKQLGEALRKLVEGKTGTDAVFTFANKPVTGAMINSYLHTLGFPKAFTVHKLRTARGTQLAMEILNSSPFKKGDGTKETVVHKWLETELLKVGTELGHMSGEKVTSATAIQNYIAPEILAEFYSKLGMRPSSKVQKAIDSASKE